MFIIIIANNMQGLYLGEIIVDYFYYHLITIMVIFFVIAAILIHRKGSSQNIRIVTKNLGQLDGFLKSSFLDYDGDLVLQSPNVVKVYASGRQTCLFAIFAYALVPRQQFVSFLFNSMFIRLKDELVIEIPVLNPTPISLALAIIRKKNIRLLTKKTYPDIKSLCKQYRPLSQNAPNVPETHSILLQKVQHIRYLLNGEKQVEMWKQHGRNVKMLYMSDVNKFSRYNMAVRMVINLDGDVLPLVEWLIGFVDRMHKARMSVGERKQARKKRIDLNIRYQSY